MIAKGPERASEENNYDRHNSMREGLLFPLYTDEKKTFRGYENTSKVTLIYL